MFCGPTCQVFGDEARIANNGARPSSPSAGNETGDAANKKN